MITRRDFIKNTALGTAAISLGGFAYSKGSYHRILGANQKLNVAVIGVRSRAKSLILGIHQCENVHIKYNCDVDEAILNEHSSWCQEKIGYAPKTIRDFRKVLEDKEIDAVFIATPEHWHAPMSILALQAGKHVYVEKPCSHNPYENELLIAAQKKYNLKVQMGNQQRSAITSQLAVKEIREGIIGEVYKGKAYYSNNRESIGIGKKIAVPETLDWELWQGPAPRKDYKDNIHPYNWHWFRNWGTGEIHNNGTHEIDVCRWALGVGLPEKVTSVGGKYNYLDDWEFADTQDVIYEFGNNKYITWSGHSRNQMKPKRPGRGATIYGSKGTIELSRNSYELYGLDGELIKSELEKEKSVTLDTAGGGMLDENHIQNFFNGIRDGATLNSAIDDVGISTMLCHLGNIAQDVKRTIKIDTATGHVLNDHEAMGFWKREYENGWEPKI